MCGFVGIFDLKEANEILRPQALKMAKKFVIEDQIGPEFIAKKMQSLLMKDYQL